MSKVSCASLKLCQDIRRFLIRKKIYIVLGSFIFSKLIFCSCSSTKIEKLPILPQSGTSYMVSAEQLRIENLKKLEMIKKKKAEEKTKEARYTKAKKLTPFEQIRIENLKKLEMFKNMRREAKEKAKEERYTEATKLIPSVPKIAPAIKPSEVENKPIFEKPTKVEKIVTLPKIGKYYAVVIGIGKYRDDKIPKLKYTTVDAEGIYNILTDPQYGNFPRDQVKLLIDEKATYYNIKSAIGTWLKRNTRKDDTVIIFFAGHGAPEDEKTYWVTYNADIDDLYGTALSNDEIADMLDRIESKKMIAFLDSCYSAATVNRTDKKRKIMIVKDPFQKFKGKGRVIITSSDGKEQSVEIDKFAHGVFTYYLLKALKGDADENKDGFIELDEVWDYVKYRVTDTARKHGSTQTPVLDGKYSAGIVLSRHPERLKKLYLQAEREKKEKELELKIDRLTELYSKGELADSQFDKAVRILESGETNKLLEKFLSDKISLITFKKVFK